MSFSKNIIMLGNEVLPWTQVGVICCVHCVNLSIFQEKILTSGNLIVMCLAVDFFGIIVFDMLIVSWFWISISFDRFGDFLVSFSLRNLLDNFSYFCPSRISVGSIWSM